MTKNMTKELSPEFVKNEKISEEVVLTGDGSHKQTPLKVKQNKQMPMWVKVLIALAPALFFLTFFTFYPIINTFLISFMDGFTFRDGAGSFSLASFFQQLNEHYNPPAHMVIRPDLPTFSFNSYANVLKDKVFLSAIGNTAILTFITVPLTIIISLLLAVFLNSIKVLRGFYQTIFFLPYVTNSIALGMVFNVLFSPAQGGIVNQMISLFGGQPISWVAYAAHETTGSQPMSKLSLGTVIVIQTVWSGLAFKILVFMAGLASIDKQYYDAARIDGATRKKIFSKITVPLLSPQIFYIMITSFIGSFKMYSNIIAVVGEGAEKFGGTDGNVWVTIVGYIYRNRASAVPGALSKAAAGAIVLLVIILFITIIQMAVSKKRVHY